ncbi:MAG: uroporphyrinogen-III synthase [Nesterenkonia sp.]|nr:uroporphyrinogen-III synthase [Nesterenkonia sp.]
MGRIVVTRDGAAAGRLEAQLLDAGHQVAHMPLTEQRVLDDDAELRRGLVALREGRYEVLLLTSANTVRALCRAGWDGAADPTTRVVVTGAGTALALEDLTGLTETWSPKAEASAAGILRELPPPRTSARALLPQSLQARSDLASGLTDQGWSVDHVPAYRTVARCGPEAARLSPDRRLIPDDGAALRPEDLRAEDVVLITSSTAAEVWAGIGDARLRPHRVLAIGAPTAATLEALGEAADAVLPNPTAHGVREALAG